MLIANDNCRTGPVPVDGSRRWRRTPPLPPPPSVPEPRSAHRVPAAAAPARSAGNEPAITSPPTSLAAAAAARAPRPRPRPRPRPQPRPRGARRPPDGNTTLALQRAGERDRHREREELPLRSTRTVYQIEHSLLLY